MLILCLFTSKFWQHYNTFGDFLPYFHCTCADVAIYALHLLKFPDIAIEFSDPVGL